MSPPLPSGVIAASLTPFHPDHSINHDAFAQHTRWLLSNGCDGVLLFGTTGEGLSLTAEERERGIEKILANGLPAESLLVGTGALALPDAVRLTQKVIEMDVGGVLVAPPFHFRQIPQEGLFRFYDRLIQQVGSDDLRLYFYHFPELFGVSIPFPLVQRLQRAYPSQVAGIKDSSGEWDHTQSLCESFPDLQVFTGTEHLFLPVLNAGGAGCISAAANVTAPVASQLVREWRQDQPPETAQEHLTRIRTAFASVPTIAALKKVLARSRASPEWTTVRPPLAPLDDNDAQEVDEIADRLLEMFTLPGTEE